MKTLTFVVPCYNSQDYMHRCIDSLLPGGNDVEIIIVNDGSSDKTQAIAEEYQREYSGIVRAVNQQNKGHGGAVNAGIREASGIYIKIVDSDDWVDTEAYLKILDALKGFSEKDIQVDMLISNFVYEKEGKRHKKIMRYTGTLPENEVFSWEQAGKFRKGQYILMHSVIYRTQMLRESGLCLPEHTFYVDNLYAFVPLPYVKTLYYLNEDFYRYYIGRADQSVNESIMIKRIDQQLKVNRFMLESFKPEKITDKSLRRYMLNYLEIITIVSSVLLIRSGTEENLEKMRELWDFIKNGNSAVYRRLRRGLMGRFIHLPGKTGRKVTVFAYRITQKIVGFN
jgi:glycosyltransferase involved in cell wall biosynthesis